MSQAPQKRLLLLSFATDLGAQLSTHLPAFEISVQRSCAEHPEFVDAVILDRDYAFGLEESEIRSLITAAEENQQPVFLIWRDEDADHREYSVQIGCSDFLSPPYFSSVLNAKLKTHLNLSSLRKQMVGHPHQMHISEHSELLAVQDAAILCLATVARVRDHSTGNHILRTQHYVKALAEHLRNHKDFGAELDEETIEIFYKTASLHDIGKVGIPDHILQKPGKLTDEEYRLMKTHTLLGYQAINSAEQLLERSTSGKAAKFLKIAQQVTLSHHERWDGTGYPEGLKADQIPVVARLMAVADVYDAMISRRPYKNELDHSEAAAAIYQASGSHFDPRVVAAFADLEDTFANISIRLEDYFPSTADLTLHSMADLIKEH